jgi:tetratricopeptide (TPR) repeat protein
MLNLAISLLVSSIVAVALITLAGLDYWIAILVSLAVFTAVYVLLIRYVMKKVSSLMETAQRDIQAGRTEKAIKTLQSGYKYSRWQFYIKGQINSQIGMILYLKRDFAGAFEYLQKGFVRHWMAMGMLAISYMKRNKPGKMIETFDKAVTVNKKEPLLWNLYAYCLEKVGEKEKAISVLEKGLKKISDERLQANLDALKEGRKMKMKAYGDLWYHFHLESQGAMIKQQTKAIQGRRKIVRR